VIFKMSFFIPNNMEVIIFGFMLCLTNFVIIIGVIIIDVCFVTSEWLLIAVKPFFIDEASKLKVIATIIILLE